MRSVPRKLPATRLPVEPVPTRTTLVPGFDTTLPAPAAVPPMMLPGAFSNTTPAEVAEPTSRVPVTSMPM